MLPGFYLPAANHIQRYVAIGLSHSYKEYSIIVIIYLVADVKTFNITHAG